MTIDDPGLTMEDAMGTWLDVMELRPRGAETANQYLLDNVEATLADYSAEDAATMLAAFSQLVSLFQVQIAGLVDNRIMQLREVNQARD